MWIKNSSAIWRKQDAWKVGNLSNIETEIDSGIETDDGYGDYCPYHVPSNKWYFYDENLEFWKSPENIKDIRIQCLQGNVTDELWLGSNC